MEPNQIRITTAIFLVVYDAAVTPLETLIASMAPKRTRAKHEIVRTSIILSDGTPALSVTGATSHPQGDEVLKAVFVTPSHDRIIMLHNGGMPTEYFERFVESATLIPPESAVEGEGPTRE